MGGCEQIEEELLETNEDEQKAADRDCLAPQRIHVLHWDSLRFHFRRCVHPRMRQRPEKPSQLRVSDVNVDNPPA
jgi:hypothetical protein